MAGNAAEVLDTTTTAEGGGAPKNSWFRTIVDKDVGEHGSSMVYLRADKLRPLGHNIRDWTLPVNIAAIMEIVETFDFENLPMDRQITEPVVILKGDEPGTAFIEKGETRWRAVLYAEGQEYAPGMRLKTPLVAPGSIKIACVQGNPNRTMLQRRIETVTQVGRQPNDLEKARFFAYLMLPKEHSEKYPEGPLGEGMSQSDIAKAIGKPGKQTYVSQIVALVRDDPDGWTVDPQVRDALAEGWIKSTTVVNTMRDVKRSGGKPVDATNVMLDLVAEAKAAETAEQEAEAAALKAGQSAPKARQRARKRVKARDVSRRLGTEVKFTANPRGHNKVNFDRFLHAIQFAASYSADPKTREGMNEVLKTCGYHEEPVLVDDKGETLENAAEIKAAWDKKNHDRRDGAKKAA